MPRVHRAAAHRVVPGLVKVAPAPPSTQLAGGNSSQVYLIPELIVIWFVMWLRSLAIWLTLVLGSKADVNHSWELLKGLVDPIAGQLFAGLFLQLSGHILSRRLPFRVVLKSKPYILLGRLLPGCRVAPRVKAAKLLAFAQMLLM